MRTGRYYWLLMAGQCVFFAFWSYTYRSIPYLDRRKIEMLKTVFYTVIVQSPTGLDGKETTFPFKWVPEYSTITETKDSDRTMPGHPSVESRNLKALGIFVAGLSVGACLVVSIAYRMLKWW